MGNSFHIIFAGDFVEVDFHAPIANPMKIPSPKELSALGFFHWELKPARSVRKVFPGEVLGGSSQLVSG